MEGDRFCHSCAAPRVDDSDSNYCHDCVDDQGNLRPREEIQADLAKWMKSWQGEITEEKAMKRAAHFMRALPAWALD